MKKLFILISMLFFLASCGDDPTSSKKKCDPACGEWQTCDTKKGECILTEGRCDVNTDCTDTTKPVCNVTTHNCEADVQPECTVNADCTNAAKPICENGVCVADIQPECTIDADCEANEICVEGVCEVVQPECTIDADCEANEICVEGVCEVVQPECTIDADCEANEICVEGVCEVVQPECTIDADCLDPANPSCVRGFCMENQDACVDLDCSGFPNTECVVYEGEAQCFCIENYYVNVDETACVSGEELCTELNCSQYGNAECVIDAEGPGCICMEGNYYDGTSCVPIPACTDDAIPNEGANALLITLPYEQTHHSCTTKVDYFKVELTAGMEFTANLSFVSGDLDLILLNAPELIEANVVDVSAEDGLIPESISITVETSGTYYLAISPYHTVDTDYTLSVSGVVPECVVDTDCEATEICMEGVCAPIQCTTNEDCEAGEICTEGRCELDTTCVDDAIGNTKETATLVTLPFAGNHKVCADVSDFFKVALNAGEIVTVNLSNYGIIDLDLYLYNETSTVSLKSSLTMDPTEQVVYTITVAGNYYVKVRNWDEMLGTNYDLSIATVASECTVDADCLDITKPLCEANVCVAAECSNEVPCGLGEVCVLGRCETAPECTVDADCADGEICDMGNCVVSVPAEWTCSESWYGDGDCDCGCGIIDSDCADGNASSCDFSGACTSQNLTVNLTQNWLCDALPPECTDDADCTTVGEICVDGECVLPPECTVDTDCADGEICDMGQCVPDTTCVDDAIGNTKETATLVTLPFTGNHKVCAAANDYFKVALNAGEIVTINLSNYGTIDLDLYLYDEVSSTDLKSSLTTNPTEQVVYTITETGNYYVRVKNYSATTQTNYDLSIATVVPECTIDANCEAGEICEANICIPVECTVDADCGAEEACVLGRCKTAAVWTCSESWYGDGDCDCGCGIIDSDCADGNASSCDFNGACTSQNLTVNPTQNWLCE